MPCCNHMLCIATSDFTLCEVASVYFVLKPGACCSHLGKAVSDHGECNLAIQCTQHAIQALVQQPVLCFISAFGSRSRHKAGTICSGVKILLHHMLLSTALGLLVLQSRQGLYHAVFPFPIATCCCPAWHGLFCSTSLGAHRMQLCSGVLSFAECRCATIHVALIIQECMKLDVSDAVGYFTCADYELQLEMSSQS